MGTSLPTPMTARVKLLIYQRVYNMTSKKNASLRGQVPAACFDWHLLHLPPISCLDEIKMCVDVCVSITYIYICMCIYIYMYIPVVRSGLQSNQQTVMTEKTCQPRTMGKNRLWGLLTRVKSKETFGFILAFLSICFVFFGELSGWVCLWANFGPKSIKLTCFFPSHMFYVQSNTYWLLTIFSVITGKNMQNWKFDCKNMSLRVIRHMTETFLTFGFPGICNYV